MTPEHHPQADHPHREGEPAAGTHNQVVFEVARDANKVQIRDAVQKLFNVKVTDVNTMVMRGKDRRMGRGYAQDAELEESDRDPQGGRRDRLLLRRAKARRTSWESRTSSRRRPARRYYSVSGLQGAHEGRQAPSRSCSSTRRAPVGETTTGESPRASAAADTSSATASSTGGGTRSACRRTVATVEYDPNRTARIALLHYVDGEKRYILAPDGLQGGRQDRLQPQRRHQARQRDDAPLHPARHDDPQHRAEEGQGRAARPLRRLGGRAHGEGRRLRAGPPAVGRGPHGAPRLPRRPSARCRTSTTRTSRSARRVARAGSGGARTTAASP